MKEKFQRKTISIYPSTIEEINKIKGLLNIKSLSDSKVIEAAINVYYKKLKTIERI